MIYSGADKRFYRATCQNRMKLSEYVYKILMYIFQAGHKKKIAKIWLNQPKSAIIKSNPLYAKNADFSSFSNAKMNSTNRKSSKNWPRKWYSLIFFNENFPRYFMLKIVFLC